MSFLFGQYRMDASTQVQVQTPEIMTSDTQEHEPWIMPKQFRYASETCLSKDVLLKKFEMLAYAANQSDMTQTCPGEIKKVQTSSSILTLLLCLACLCLCLICHSFGCGAQALCLWTPLCVPLLLLCHLLH